MRAWVTCSLVCWLTACGGAARKQPTPPTNDDDAVPWSASGVDWSVVPAPGPEPAFRPPAPATMRLENGMTVIVVENHRLPLVSVRLVNSVAGGARDPARLKGLAALTADMLDEGAGNWSALELANQAERLGATLDTSAGVEASYVGIDGLASTLDASLELLAAVVAAPKLESADFERVKGDHLSMLERRRDEASSVASLVFDRVLFGAHAYGLPNSGIEASVKQIQREDVVQFYANHYAPEQATVILVGDVSAESLREPLERTLGHWQARATAPSEPNLSLPRSRPPRLVVCDKPGAAQSAIRIGRLGLTRRDPRYFDAVVLNTVIGGSFTSRLNNRLREQLGYTYGVRSSFWFARYAGSWRVHTSVKAENTADAIREILAIVERARDQEIPADELARNKQYLIRQFPQEFESNPAIAESVTDLVVHGLPLTWYAGYRDGIGSASAERARSLAADAWTTDQLHLIVVGDLERVLGDLLGLGFGEALEVDAEGEPVRIHPMQ